MTRAIVARHSFSRSWATARKARVIGCSNRKGQGENDMSLADQAAECIDRDELIDLTLSICNIDSRGPHEGEVAEAVHSWLEKEGFRTRKIGLFAERYNVMGTLPGSGGGYSLLFNSHMDTSWTDPWVYNDPDAEIYRTAWMDNDGNMVGEGVVNDKGPMAAFLIAAKAVKASGVNLKGDLLLTAVIGETSQEQCEDPPGVIQESKDLGARFLVTHGGVADYALIAEGTGFSIVGVEAGMSVYRVTWVSDQARFYTPYLPDRTTLTESPNMIVRAAVGIQALEGWAAEYQRRYTREFKAGRVVPKAQVGGIKGGNTKASNAPQVCSVYVGAFTPPGLDPLALRDEISTTLNEAGVPATHVDLYHFRRGYEAQNADRLIDALRDSHIDTFGEPPAPANPATSSMWRDVNIFNEVGIPAVTYGPRMQSYPYTNALSVDSLYDAARVYARLIVNLCNQEKSRLGAVPGMVAHAP